MSTGIKSQEKMYEIYHSHIAEAFVKINVYTAKSKAKKHKNASVYSRLMRALDDAFGVEYD